MLRRKDQQQAYQTATSSFNPNDDKHRIVELSRQVEENNQQIMIQKLEIGQLKQQIVRLLEGGAHGHVSSNSNGMNSMNGGYVSM